MTRIVILLILFQFLHGVETLTCLSCNNLVQPYDCDTVIDCGDNEECYTERQITDDGHVYYNVGCKETSRCMGVPFGKRNTLICSACCNSDLCNMNSMCGSKDVPTAQGRQYCYSCPHGRSKSDDCNTIQLCQHNQMCHIQKQSNTFGETRWITGCASSSQCLSLTPGCSEYCCDSDICNKNCSLSLISTTLVPQTTSNNQVTTPHNHGTTQDYQGTTIDNQSTTPDIHHSTSKTTTEDWQRTVILIEKFTGPFEYIFIRGGINRMHREGCFTYHVSSDRCAIPIRSHSLGNTSLFTHYNAWRRGDNFLDWHGREHHQGYYNDKRAQGTPAVWTTNRHDAVDYNKQNTYGDHYWLVDIDMDCDKTMNGWFELYGMDGVMHEKNIQQSQYVCGNWKVPYESTHHWARCGMKNVFHYNHENCSIVHIS